MTKRRTLKSFVKNYYGIVILLFLSLFFTIAWFVQNSFDDKAKNRHIAEWGISSKFDAFLDEWEDSFSQVIMQDSGFLSIDDPAMIMLEDTFTAIEKKNNEIRNVFSAWEGTESARISSFSTSQLFANEQVVKSDNEFILYENGVVFGPYQTIQPGEYTIEFLGSNMNNCVFDAFANSNWYAVNYTIQEQNDTIALLNLSILEPVNDIEFRMFNSNSNEAASLKRIILKKNNED